MNFTKMHGLGNDYIYINGFTETVANPAESSGLFHLARFGIGQVVKHRVFSFRGVIFDVGHGLVPLCRVL